MAIGILIHAHLHKIDVKVKPELNGFMLIIDAGADVINIQATSEQIELIGQTCLHGLENEAMKEIEGGKHETNP